MFKLKANSGVTLLEVLLVVAILAILLIFSIPVYESVQTRNDLSIAVMNSAHALRRAKLLAEASDGDASWGVKFGTSTLVLFRGLSFATRNPSFDEIFDLPSSIKITDTDEIV
ncbi:MAG: prepilin-type N-terminal cleavage/methylation domain-containing protein, partial [Candidatus Liptonbacteria bacterium]|nr:prepilin-type N-terminal cleavage/methylation domain-containing protein [Candidatus Liptonbacteria bacterium]